MRRSVSVAKRMPDVVPTISSLVGRPGQDAGFTLNGSGFMEVASTITIGGVPYVDDVGNARWDVSGARNSVYSL